MSIITFSVWVKAIALLLSTLFYFFAALGNECTVGDLLPAKQALLFFSGCKAHRSDLILQGQRQTIRACIIFLLCVGRAVEPSLHGDQLAFEGFCLHLQMVPEGVSAVSSLCTTVSILLPT